MGILDSNFLDDLTDSIDTVGTAPWENTMRRGDNHGEKITKAVMLNYLLPVFYGYGGEASGGTAAGGENAIGSGLGRGILGGVMNQDMMGGGGNPNPAPNPSSPAGFSALTSPAKFNDDFMGTFHAARANDPVALMKLAKSDANPDELIDYFRQASQVTPATPAGVSGLGTPLGVPTPSIGQLLT